jgi:hypothetical protein
VEKDERQVADELIRPMPGRRVNVNCGKWKGEGKVEERLRSNMEVIRTYRIVYGCPSERRRVWWWWREANPAGRAAPAETAEGWERNPERVPLLETCWGETSEWVT